jgi:tetratricopeptide (TPR) repeat protein
MRRRQRAGIAPASLARTRDLLRRLRRPHLLDEDDVARRLRAVLGTATTLQAMHRILDEALQHQDPRIRHVVERFDLGREPGKVVADQLHLSERQFYRLRAIAMDAVTRRIEEILVRATPEPRGTDLDTWALYGRGRYLIGRRERSALTSARRCFEAILRRDPHFARAYAALAEVYLLSAEYSLCDPAFGFAQARRAIDSALELDRTLAETLAAAGDLAVFADGNSARARTLVEAAIACDPGYTTSYQHAAWLEILQHDYAKAFSFLHEGLLREPQSLVLQTTLGVALLESRQTERAIEQLRSVVDVDGGFPVPRFHLAAALAESGRFEEALAELEFLIAEDPLPTYLAAAGFVRGRMGDRLGALRQLRAIDAHARRGRPARELRAVVLAGIGQLDGALAELDAVVLSGNRLGCPVCLAPFFRPLEQGRLAALLYSAQHLSIA